MRFDHWSCVDGIQVIAKSGLKIYMESSRDWIIHSQSDHTTVVYGSEVAGCSYLFFVPAIQVPGWIPHQEIAAESAEKMKTKSPVDYPVSEDQW